MNAPVNNARLAAQLQATTLAIVMFGLEAINDGRVSLRNGAYLYRGYHVGPAAYSPAPQFDWEFHHEDYDGAPDGNDNRCGRGASAADCMSQIDDLIEEAS